MMFKFIAQIYFLCLSLLPNTVFAAASSEIEKSTPINTFSMMNILNMAMGLIVVIALILSLAWILKKYGRIPNNNLVNMKVLGGLSLGTREKALLIEVENIRLLVGVTPGHIQTLLVLDESKQSSKSLESFDATLNKIVEKNND